MSAVWSSDEPPRPARAHDARLARVIAGVTTLGAGLLMVVGGVNAWTRAGSEGQPFFFPLSSLLGDYGWEGTVTIVLGVVTMAIAGATMLVELPPSARAVPVVTGATAIALVLFHLATFEERYADILVDLHFAPADLRIGYPAIVAIVGGVFAVIGGVFAILAGRADQPGLEPGARGAAATPPS